MTTFKNIFPMRVQTIFTEMLSYTNVNQAIQIEKRVDNERPIYIRYVPWNMIAVYHKKVFAYVTSYMTVNNLKFAPIYYHDIYDNDLLKQNNENKTWSRINTKIDRHNKQKQQIIPFTKHKIAGLQKR